MFFMHLNTTTNKPNIAYYYFSRSWNVENNNDLSSQALDLMNALSIVVILLFHMWHTLKVKKSSYFK